MCNHLPVWCRKGDHLQFAPSYATSKTGHAPASIQQRAAVKGHSVIHAYCLSVFAQAVFSTFARRTLPTVLPISFQSNLMSCSSPLMSWKVTRPFAWRLLSTDLDSQSRQVCYIFHQFMWCGCPYIRKCSMVAPSQVNTLLTTPCSSLLTLGSKLQYYAEFDSVLLFCSSLLLMLCFYHALCCFSVMIMCQCYWNLLQMP